jgi:hypothetical protein
MKVSDITRKINSFFQMVDAKITKVIPFPAILLLCAARSRQGLSPMRSLTNICQSLEEQGIPTGSNPDGSPNLIVSVTYEILKEIYRAQTEDAVVQGSIEPGAMMIQTNGANAGGPVVSIGTNMLPTHTWGIIN